MKKLMMVLMAVLFSVSFVGAALAQGGGEVPEKAQFMTKMGNAKTVNFEGTVLSHDTICHCFVVKTGKGNVAIQDDYVKFYQEYDKAKGLQIGSKIKGKYKVVDYLNYGTEVEYVK